MDKDYRNCIQRASQEIRNLLEEDFTSQLLQIFDIDVLNARWLENPGSHLYGKKLLIRDKLIAWILHKEAQFKNRKETLQILLREMAFTTLNRFIALKLMEERDLVRPCISNGLKSEGFLEFTALCQGLLDDQWTAYQLYLETIFEDISCELKSLFDPREFSSLIWPSGPALLKLLEIINQSELSKLWVEDETLGWFYQYFNNDSERKKMRNESPFPRSSRELAIRNQFFTPRYVVEFLTDNTLGLIWYEMLQGNTELKNTCKYLRGLSKENWVQANEKASKCISNLNISNHISARPIKDPREIRMIDPACGSMHFGLYSFDIFFQIYSEAWDIARDSSRKIEEDSLFKNFVTFSEKFQDKVSFLREVPRLILHYNIHGIDIDVRATQISRLSLWFRAQKTWINQKVEINQRPRIKKSNLVCAEPMPGNFELLANCASKLFKKDEIDMIMNLLENIFKKMELAGELGSLLKIEDDIRSFIIEFKKDYNNSKFQQSELDLFQKTKIRNPLSDYKSFKTLGEKFWSSIEEKIYKLLDVYASQTNKIDKIKRHLFVDEISNGFTFIDICRKKYDVILMNPPFGNPTTSSTSSIRLDFPKAKDNLLIAFIERFFLLLERDGKLGAITDRSWINKKYYEAFRKDFVLAKDSLEIWVDLGWGVLDANVEVAAQIHSSSNFQTFFLNISEQKEKEEALMEASKNKSSYFVHSLSSFSNFPGTSFVYDLDPAILHGFINGSKVSKTLFKSFGGLKAGNSKILFRLEWEISPEDLINRKWARIQNGSPFSPYYYSCNLTVRCDKNDFKSVLSITNSHIANVEHYFKPGIFYGKRTDWMYGYKGRSGQIPSMEGHLVLPQSYSDFWFSLLVINTSVYQEIANKLCGQHKYAQYINPMKLDLSVFPDKSNELKIIVNDLESIDRGSEVSSIFFAPLSLEIWNTNPQAEFLKCIKSAILKREEVVKRANQFRSDYNAEVEAKIGWKKSNSSAPVYVDYVKLLFQSSDSLRHEASNIVSYLIGVVFGRWDIRKLKNGLGFYQFENSLSPLPDHSQAKLTNIYSEKSISQYPLTISLHGLLVCNMGHPFDIVGLLRLSINYLTEGKISTEKVERIICNLIDVRKFEDYFNNPSGFFADHLKRYSRNRRQAPIYWLISAGNGSFSAWLYYHRFNQDTIYRLLRDLIEPRIEQTNRERFEFEAQSTTSNDINNELKKSETLLKDLLLLKKELDLVAPLWKPNLNDGVIINYSLLWRIIPYPTWQNKCKECWDKLASGEYDWAHLAFHLWPERVIVKCIYDKSLAIAHGLEKDFWLKDGNGKWISRNLSDDMVNSIINEAKNPAIKLALKRFTEAELPF